MPIATQSYFLRREKVLSILEEYQEKNGPPPSLWYLILNEKGDEGLNILEQEDNDIDGRDYEVQ